MDAFNYFLTTVTVLSLHSLLFHHIHCFVTATAGLSLQSLFCHYIHCLTIAVIIFHYGDDVASFNYEIHLSGTGYDGMVNLHYSSRRGNYLMRAFPIGANISLFTLQLITPNSMIHKAK